MLWVVAALLFIGITLIVRRYDPAAAARADRPDERPRDRRRVHPRQRRSPRTSARNGRRCGRRSCSRFFIFILGANLIGLIPIFDVLGLLDHYVLHSDEQSFINRLVHGSSTATGNSNVTAGLAVITFLAIIVAGTRAHGFVQHWINLVPHGLPKPLYVLLIPLEIIGMLVRPFALTARLAANMTGGHIAILAITSFVFIVAEGMGAMAGVAIGAGFSVPLTVAILGARD